MKDIKTFKDLKSIAITFVTAILFFSCNSNEGTVVFEDPKVSPQGVAENFILYYTETAEFSEIPMEVAMGGALKKDARLIDIPEVDHPLINSSITEQVKKYYICFAQ